MKNVLKVSKVLWEAEHYISSGTVDNISQIGLKVEQLMKVLHGQHY